MGESVADTTRVLVADDEKGLRSLLQFRLEQEGFEVETVSDGESALELLQVEDPPVDVLILDLGMPKMDGFEVLRRLQELDTGPLVIVLSGRDDEEMQLRAYELGAVDYVTKPFSPAILATKVRKQLTDRS